MARLNQEDPMIRFYKTVLGWDYFRLAKESNQRKSKKATVDESTSGLKEVKDRFADVDDYLSTFEPLLFEEVKAHIIQDEKKDDEVRQWATTVYECNEADGFHSPVVGYDEGQSVSQNDLLLLSKEEFKQVATIPQTYAFALVDHRQSDGLRLRMYLQPASKRLMNMQELITSAAGQKILYCVKICSLSTIAREYIALRSVGSLPFKDLILTGTDTNETNSDQAWRISEPLHHYIHENLNTSQKQAIDVGLSRKPFVLIQGPPGTGKTQTILALLSAILHATPSRVKLKVGGLREIKLRPEITFQEKYRHWARASPWLGATNPRDDIMPEDGDDGFFPITGSELKPQVVDSARKYRFKVLVCAPSNSALDEIVLRILHNGVRDENVNSYNPKIVRIGLKPHHSVKSVAMDDLVKQKLGDSASNKHKHGSTGSDPESIRSAVLDDAAIVFSTLSFSGKLSRGFDVVIIDEAAQAVEPATLIPLANGCKQVYLVGDPDQLPATVISKVAENFGYGTSMFKRLQKAGYPVHMLTIQYRMHPEISHFPSREFYGEKLEDGPGVKIKRDWHDYRCFGPFCFLDLYEGRESHPSGSRSWVNIDEVEFVLLLYKTLLTMYPDLKSSCQLAIISPYDGQVKLLRDRFKEAFGVESERLVDIGTIDGFQGREKDIVIFSCVRANNGAKNEGIGFVSDYRRMNVGITRAKSSVLVVGSASTLRRDDVHWNNLVESAEKRNVLYKVPKPYASFFNDQSMGAMKVATKKVIENAALEAIISNVAVDIEQGATREHDDLDMNGGDADDD